MLYLGALAIVLGLGVGRVRGGSLAGLAEIKLHYPWVVFLALGIQVLLFLTPLAQYAEAYAGWLQLATNLLLITVVLLNLHIRGMAVVAVGLALNTAVIALNGGFMPVSAAAARTAGILEKVEAMQAQAGHAEKGVLMTEKTVLPYLADIIPVPAPVSHVFSPGDLLIATGGFLLVALGMGSHHEGLSAP